MTSLCCSFCGKSQDKVRKLLAGANAYICNECVKIADRIVKSGPDDPEPQDEPPSWRAPRK